MAISLTNIGTNSTKANAATMTVSVPAGGVPSGSLIVLCVGGTLGLSATIPADTASNTYHTTQSGSPTAGDAIWYAFNCAALSSGNTITVTYSGTGGVECASAFYATGVQTASNPLDAFSLIATGTSAAPSVTTNQGGSDSAGTTSVTGELIVGLVRTTGPSGDTFTQDSTNEGGFSNFPVRVGTTGGSQTSNDTIAGGAVAGWGSTGKPTYAPAITSRAWAALIATFKPAPVILPSIGWLKGDDHFPPKAILFQADTEIPRFVPKPPPAPVGISGMAWWHGADDTRPSRPLELRTRSPDEAYPFFAPSPVPVLMQWTPPTGEDRERLPPIPRSPDETIPFFRPSQHPVPSIWLAATGEDRERLPPVGRSPDETWPFFTRSAVPVPARWMPKTNEDVERLPPVKRSPDESFPFFVRSRIPVPTAWPPKTGEDIERLPPVGRSPDEATPWFRPSQVPVPTILWINPWDQPPWPIKYQLDQVVFIQPQTTTPVPVSGMAWFNPSSDQPQPAKSLIDQTPFVGLPAAVTTTIAGMAWFNPGEARLPIGPRSPDEATPFFIQSPSPVPAQWLPGPVPDYRIAPPIEDRGGAFVPRQQSFVGISGIAWYVPGERYQPVLAVEDRPTSYVEHGPPAVGIAGMAWFNPPEFPRPVGFPAAGIDVSARWVPLPFTQPIVIVTTEWILRARRRHNR